jgi:hypothetical protein
VIQFYPEDPNRNNGKTKMRGQVKHQIDENTYRVAFDNGKQRTYEYEEIINMINHDDEDAVDRWTYERIMNHRWSPLDVTRKTKELNHERFVTLTPGPLSKRILKVSLFHP